MIVGCNTENFPKCVIGSETWFNIGKLIHSLSDGSEEGYKLWDMYSFTDFEKYGDGFHCYEMWDFFESEWFTYDYYSSNTLEEEDECEEPEDLPEGW